MDIRSPKTIEDYVFLFLQKGALKIVDLIEKIKEKRAGTTKQGVYAVLRDLKKKETVVVHKKEVSLSTVWLLDMARYFSLVQGFYTTAASDNNSFLNLKDGEKLQYFFKSPVQTDAFWSHAFYTLVDISSAQVPVVIYNPHEWFLLVRGENETKLFDFITKRGQKLALVAGNNTWLDKWTRKYFDGEKKMYETLEKPLFEKNSYYVNVIGDFVIEVWLDREVAVRLDEFYAKTVMFTEKEQVALGEIVYTKGRNKFSISKNKLKADRLRKKLGKYFFT